MSWLRDRWWVLALGGILLLGLGAAAWVAVGERWRAWRWTQLAQAPLDDDEQAALAACGEDPGWTVWLKVLHTDPDLACGEVWAVNALAEHASHGGRAEWMATIVDQPGAPLGSRMRAATALLVGGTAVRTEPAWLWLDLPPERGAAWLEASRDPRLGAQLGPAMEALRTARDVAAGDPAVGDRIVVLRWLAETGDPRAVSEAEAAVTRAGVDPELAHRLADRRARGWPVATPPLPGRAALAASCTGATCLEERLDALAAWSVDAGEGPPAAATVPAPPDPVLDALVGDRRDRLAWQLTALRAWIDAAPEPAVRLAALLGRPTGPIGRLAWDGGGPPYTVAALADRLATPGPELRADRADAVVFRTRGGAVVRSCDPAATATAGDALPTDVVLARASLEQAPGEPDARAVIAARARHLDPSLPPPPVTGDPVSFRIGGHLAPAPPGRAFADDRWCRDQ